MNARLVLIRALRALTASREMSSCRRLLLTLAAIVGVPALAAAQTTTQVVEYYATDALGSIRAVTKQVNGQWEVVTRHDFMPFGEEVSPQIPPQDKRLFTGKERDSETGLDYFEARYLRAGLGRFTTVDPVHANALRLASPQRLNLYAYAKNNPLAFIDPDGQDIVYAGNLKNAQTVKDSVQAILADPRTAGSLSGYVGPNNPNLIIQSGDLSAGDTRTVNPDGSVTTATVKGNTATDIQTTSSSSTDMNGVTTTTGPETTLKGATITIDNRTGRGDIPGVMVHESVHAGEAKANPAKFAKDAAAEKSNPNHDARPQEQRANAAQKAHAKGIQEAVKRTERDRKKENQ